MAQPKPRVPRHGGRLERARRRFLGASEPFININLSTGITALAYPVPGRNAAAWTRLPEPEDIAPLEQAAPKAYALGRGARGGPPLTAVGLHVIVKPCDWRSS